VEHHPVGKECSSVVSIVALRILKAYPGSDAIERYLNEKKKICPYEPVTKEPLVR
jgi:hypothetical protein